MEPVLKVKIQPLEYIYPPASLLPQFPCLLLLMGPRDAKDKAPRSVINRFFKNSIKRITESRWTLIFTVAAIVQFVAIFIIQMFIMFYNIEEMNRLTELDDKRTVIYPNSMDDPLTVAYDRYVRLVFENIFFIVFIFMMGIFGIDGVIRQNTVQLIAYCAISGVNLAFGVTQIGEYVTWKKNLVDLDGKWNITLDLTPVDQARNYAIGIVVALIVFTTLFVFLGWKLYLQFGWNIYKRIGADLTVQAMYKTYQLFLVFLKLSPFFQFFFFVFWAVIIPMLHEYDRPPNAYVIFHIIVCFLNFIFMIWAGAAVRNEWLYPLIGYIFAQFVMFVDFIAIYIIFGTYWIVWDFVIMCGILECALNTVFTVLVIRNFGKGLKDCFTTLAFHNDDPEVNMDKFNKWTIDDDELSHTKAPPIDEDHHNPHGDATLLETVQIDQWAIDRPTNTGPRPTNTGPRPANAEYEIEQLRIEMQEHPIDLSTQAGF
ncbi:hypothetical protein BC936DRAFT_147492 [Jimgerdemannia flammicorona]|uniref:Uncharacterized protein n=1 Tax=Jimgerdemannia flammicorona TaxID=994334 RepID=A0A433DKZ0_9FUNG|nr:hypothetical protein BC936DRAFT_147492 [Jimgerdemannia flammicorona]